MNENERARKKLGTLYRPLAESDLQAVLNVQALFKSFLPHGAELARLSKPFLAHHVELEKLSKPLLAHKVELDKLSKPFSARHVELEKLSKPLSQRAAELEKLSKLFIDTSIIAKYASFRPLLDKTIASTLVTDELLRSLSNSTISETLKLFHWKDLKFSIAAAAEGLESSTIRSAVGEALNEAAEDETDSSVAFGSFAHSLLQKLDPSLAIQFVFMLLFFLATPHYDYYVKDALSKVAQTEDRRALAKEISGEIAKLDFGSMYMSSRRVVMKPMPVRMNPKMNSPRIGAVRMGEVVAVVRVQTDWTHVTWRDSNGHELAGWVLTRYLQPLK